MGGAYEGARYMLGGANGGDAARSSGSDVPDVRTLNGMQQGMPQERFTLRSPGSATDGISHGRRQRRRAHGAAAGAAAAAGAVAAGEQSSGSDFSAPRQTARPQRRPEPSFNELRREALARLLEAA